MKLLTLSLLSVAAIAPTVFGNSLRVTVAMDTPTAEDAQAELVSRRRYRSQNGQYQGGTGRREILSHRVSDAVVG